MTEKKRGKLSPDRICIFNTDAIKEIPVESEICTISKAGYCKQRAEHGCYNCEKKIRELKTDIEICPYWYITISPRYGSVDNHCSNWDRDSLSPCPKNVICKFGD
jgi:hypothetical protein